MSVHQRPRALLLSSLEREPGGSSPGYEKLLTLNNVPGHYRSLMLYLGLRGFGRRRRSRSTSFRRRLSLGFS